jgi:hypothetical protein
MTWKLLDQLEQWKSRFGSGKSVELEKLLVVVRRLRLPDAASLIRLHETLLFLRAYPRSPNVARLADEILFSFADRVAALETQGEDLSALAEPEVSGIAGTSFSAVFTYEVARRLAKLHPRELAINWEDYENASFGAVMSRFLPLLEEDWPVEANVPYRAWLRAAVPGKERGLSWLLERFDSLPVVAREQARLYESLQLPLVWDLGNSRSTRSRMRLPGGTLFCHDAPLLRRSDISLSSELAGPPLSLTKLSLMDARRILDMILDTSAIRYRELYGFTHPDTRCVFRADIGRGVQIIVFGVPPEWRLPLRAYHSALFFKNGVPIGYVEVLSLFERAEVGFNLYYTFREGESTWLYAQVLRLFRGLLGVSCFSVDPYQLGHHNQEAIDSGAFWFYRKLGFRPLDPGFKRLVEREEGRIRGQSGYRTPPRTLKKLAEGYMIFEGPGAQHGAWDRFRVRNVGFAVEHKMARHFGGDAGKMRRATSDHLSRALGIESMGDLALVVSLIPSLDKWTQAEKSALAAILRAKEGANERRYLRLLQRHVKFRDAVLRLGSSRRA